jgi:hypothetical protein
MTWFLTVVATTLIVLVVVAVAVVAVASLLGRISAGDDHKP